MPNFITTDYNKFIADAAKEFVAEVINEQDNQKFLFSKLDWMIDAKKHGWNPESFEPSCLD